jgi:hypothetical protein
MPGAFEEYFMNPGGGSPVRENPMSSLNMIGLDLGLWAFSSYAVPRITNFMTADTLRVPSILSKKELIQRYGKDKWKHPRIINLMANEGRGGLGPANMRMLGRKAKRHHVAKAKQIKADYTSWGKYIKRLSIVSAAMGLFDLGFSAAFDMATPGVSRENLERDRHNTFSNEQMLDTRMAYTQRQRAMQAIHDSQLSVGRALVGQEASYLHR